MWIQLKKAYFGQEPGKRVDVEEPHAKQLIEQGIAEPVPGEPLSPLIEKAMAGAMEKLSEGMNQAITAALKQVADLQTQAKKHAVPALFGPGKDGDPKKNFGDWCLAVARNDRSYLEKHYGSHFVEYTAKASLAEASGVTGGYVVPPEFYQGIMDLAAEDTFFRKRAFVQPMGSATLMFPYLDVTTVQSAGVSPFFGGVQMYWTEEAQTRTETEPQFKMMELKAHELSGYAVSSNVLLQDAAFGLERYLMKLFGKAIGWFEEYAFLQGNGVGKPLGILNAGASISVGRNTSNQFKYADAAAMISNLLPSSQKRAIWAVHPYVIKYLVQLADSSGRLVWVPNIGGAQDSIPGTLFGLPVFTTEKLPALGNTGDVILIDPALYVVGDRMGLEIAASEHVNFLKNQMTWRVVERVDGQPWLEKPITLQDGASTVSPFVYLHS
jgi:HK97 family phage major capsid protein